jgi:ubiquinone/menaquinone biosynthesis C-methylase UbiE
MGANMNDRIGHRRCVLLLLWLGALNCGPAGMAQSVVSRAAQNDSVQPGINANFLDPNLDVDQWVERFEGESREIFRCRKAIVEAVGLTKGDRVADIGAGTGLFTMLFADEVGRQGWVFAVDIAPRFVERIGKLADERELTNVTPVLGSERNVRLSPGSIDVAFVCDTYHHFEYPQSTLSSIKRALRPGGRLVIVDFERIAGQTREWVLGHVRAGKDTVRQEIQDAGFQFLGETKIEGLEENYFIVFKR